MAKAQEQRQSAGESGKKKEQQGSRDGRFLLGSATFQDIGDGRFKCSETGHEMPAKEVESYGNCKRCRLALIDLALANKKAPLNLFKQDPLSRSKLICKLTGDTINKSEEHIWNHINGKRFLNKLEQKEAEKLTPKGKVEKDDKQSRPKIKTVKKDPKIKAVKKDQKNEANSDFSHVRDPTDKNSDEEPDFWVPPVGSRWDFDDGKDRWASCTSSDDETDNGVETGVTAEETTIDSGDLSSRTKRTSIAVGPSNPAPRKKSKVDPSTAPSEAK